MKTYTVQCPLCGAVNRNLHLEEPMGGWNATIATKQCKYWWTVCAAAHWVENRSTAKFTNHEGG